MVGGAGDPSRPGPTPITKHLRIGVFGLALVVRALAHK